MRWISKLFQRVDVLQLLFRPATTVAPAVTSFSATWDVLGPFTIGTREAAWGADPLTDRGGFHTLQRNDTSHFASSIAVNGTTTWSTAHADIGHDVDSAAGANLSVGFPDIDWHFQQQVYGWAALQWQGWARGHIFVQTSDTEVFNLYLDHVLEFWIDDSHYFGGDFYAFHKAPMTLRLAPGVHTIEVRLIRDVRSMGGMTSNPSVNIQLSIKPSRPALHQTGPVLFPDRLNDWRGPLASTYASVILRNDNNTDLLVTSIKARRNACVAQLALDTPTRLVPGQARPIGFQIDCIPGTSAYLSIDLHFSYHAAGSADVHHELLVGVLAEPPVSRQEAHRYTFLHPGGIVSYAMLKPPPPGLDCGKTKLPVLMVLHGAGVEASSEEARHALDGLGDTCAWILFPTGVTSWSGDDWHTWGWTDVEAAVAAIPNWIERVGWQGADVDISQWLVIGHSNGGQGTWYAATHHPDKVIAAAPLSGYSSIQNYVPYTFWTPAEPERTAVMRAQLNDYEHELLIDNVQGIPLLQQHGSVDDNVPVYHSRLMFGLAQQAGIDVEYIEMPGKPHYWEGVMSTPHLAAFIKAHTVENGTSGTNAARMCSLSLVSANPGSTGSKHGVRIMRLITPGILGRIKPATQRRHDSICYFTTENVENLQLQARFVSNFDSVFLDDQMIDLSRFAEAESVTLQRSQGAWLAVEHRSSTCERATSQYGGLEAMLRTKGTFHVVQHSSGTQHIAVQVANNLLQYYGADTNIAAEYSDALTASGNIISLAVGSTLPATTRNCTRACAFVIDEASHLCIERDGDILRSFQTQPDAVIAAAYLRPLSDDRTELVLWALDAAALENSAHLLPLMTGGGQPDFVIITNLMMSRGLQGVAAMGFFDTNWCPSSTSFFADTLS